MRRRFHLPAILTVLALTGGAVRAADYAIGADLSFLKQAEERGTALTGWRWTRPVTG
jgi:hypothetical protein